MPKANLSVGMNPATIGLKDAKALSKYMKAQEMAAWQLGIADDLCKIWGLSRDGLRLVRGEAGEAAPDTKFELFKGSTPEFPDWFFTVPQLDKSLDLFAFLDKKRRAAHPAWRHFIDLLARGRKQAAVAFAVAYKGNWVLHNMAGTRLIHPQLVIPGDEDGQFARASIIQLEHFGEEAICLVK